MIILAEWFRDRMTAELIVALVGMAAIAFVVFRWIREAPDRPDPWDEEMDQEIASDQAQPLCCRCLTPHGPSEHFCPKCGAPVGDLVNFLPFEYIFSVGYLFRIGTSGDYRASPLTVMGFIIFSLTKYSIFAPFYLALLIGNLPTNIRRTNFPDQTASID